MCVCAFFFAFCLSLLFGANLIYLTDDKYHESQENGGKISFTDGNRQTTCVYECHENVRFLARQSLRNDKTIYTQFHWAKISFCRCFSLFFPCSWVRTFPIKRTSTTTMTTTTNRKLITPNDKWFNYLLHKPSVLFLLRDQNTFQTTRTLLLENCFSAYAFEPCVCFRLKHLVQKNNPKKDSITITFSRQWIDDNARKKNDGALAFTDRKSTHRPSLLIQHVCCVARYAEATCLFANSHSFRIKTLFMFVAISMPSVPFLRSSSIPSWQTI